MGNGERHQSLFFRGCFVRPSIPKYGLTLAVFSSMIYWRKQLLQLSYFFVVVQSALFAIFS